METVHVSECSPIVLSVEANTDVGGSGNSNNTTTGFPKCKLSHYLICVIYDNTCSFKDNRCIKSFDIISKAILWRSRYTHISTYYKGMQLNRCVLLHGINVMYI